MGERENQKIQTLVEMGKRVHKMAREGRLTDPELMALSGQLTQLDAVANAHLGKKPPVKGDGPCPTCGAHFVGAFCGACGLNVDEFFEKPVFTCNSCGYVVGDEDVFCGICGNKRGQNL